MGKGRRGSGVTLANSPYRLEQHEAVGGWRGRVRVLSSSTLGAAATKEDGACWLVALEPRCCYVDGCALLCMFSSVVVEVVVVMMSPMLRTATL